MDNTLFPSLVKTLKENKDNCDILAWPIVHNYALGRYYEVLYPQPLVGHVDYCSYMIKTDLMRQIGYNAIQWSGQDGLIAEEAAKRGIWKTINAVLATHN